MKKLRHCIGYTAGVLALIACLGVVAGGCSKSSGKSVVQEKSTTDEPKKGGVLKISTLGLDTADPHRHTGSIAVQQVYVEGLTGIASNGSVKPFLCDSFSISSDGLNYTFNLRDAVFFHNGREMTAEDVAANFARVKKLARGWLAGAMKLITEVRVDGDRTVVVTLSEPYAPFTALLSELWIIAPESAGWDDTITHPIGTGPFKFGDWQPDVGILCSRHDQYWQEGLPYLDAVYFDLGESTTADLKLRAGDLHIVSVGANQDKIEKLSKEGFQIKFMKDSSWIFWAFNNRKPRAPFDNPKVREAISYGMDKSALLAVVAGDKGVPSAQMAAPGSFYHNEELDTADRHLKQDLDKCRSMLKELQVDPTTITLKFVTWQNDYSLIAAEMLKNIGFKVEHLALDDLGAQNELGKYEWDMTTMGSGPRADIYMRYIRLLSDGPNPVLWGGIQDPELDTLIGKAVTTVDDQERRRNYLDAYNRVMEKYYFVVAGHYMGGLALAPNVAGFEPGFTWSPHNVDGGLVHTWLR